MRKSIALIALFALLNNILLAQNAVLHLNLIHGKVAGSFLNMPSQPISDSFSTVIKDSSAAVYNFKLDRPEFVNIYCFDSTDRSGKYFTYLFYLSLGDDLEFKADFSKPDFNIEVSGKGSNNNQPLMSAMQDFDKRNFLRDSLPYRVINVINDAQKTAESNFEKYVKLYNPTPSYIRDWKISLRYYACDLYYNFKEENRLYTFDAYYRNLDKWQKINDSLFSIVKLNDDHALGAFHYMELLNGFSEREWEKLSDEEWFHPEAFYRKWYHTDTVEGKKLFASDRKNLPREMIIDRYFAGKTAEYLYAQLIHSGIQEAAAQNIPEIFARFKAQYPESKYIPLFAPSIDAILAKRKNVLTDKMAFMTDNGTKLNSLDDVIVAMKGKTVLVDMWGTWCSPCREEIERHSASIRDHFKDKNLEYLYIANDDLNNVEQWKKLIAYFDIEGTHMLASDSLTKDIMSKVHGIGFPTLFIIKKDGTFELSKTQSPIDEDILVKQLEDALAQ